MIMDIKTFFEKLCGLKEIFYYRDNLLNHLQECLDVKYYEQARYVGICGILAEEFLKNVSPLWPNELKYLSAQSIRYSDEVYTTISQFAAIILHKIALKYIEYERQVNIYIYIFQYSNNKSKIKDKKLNVNYYFIYYFLKKSLPERIIAKFEENKNRVNSKKQSNLSDKNGSNQQQLKPGNESLMKNIKPINDEYALMMKIKL